MSTIIPLPAFSDNYIWVIVPESGPVTVVDPGDAAPVQHWLSAQQRQLGSILITHHHADHIGGVAELVQQHAPQVFAPVDRRIPGEYTRVADGDRICVQGAGEFEVLACDGHTIPHIAYYQPGTLLVGDTLFAAGCGRLFEGSPAQMHHSLQRLNRLPADTRVYCAHEYTLANLRFAMAVEPDNTHIAARFQREQERRRQQQPTLPSTLALERDTNPFLRTDAAAARRAVEQRLGHPAEDAVAVFASLRRWKDDFRA